MWKEAPSINMAVLTIIYDCETTQAGHYWQKKKKADLVKNQIKVTNKILMGGKRDSQSPKSFLKTTYKSSVSGWIVYKFA